MLFILQSPDWLQEWEDKGLVLHTFRTLGLDPKTSDRVVYQRCRELGLYLITGNRNHDGPDSLEATLRDAGLTAPPVFTLGNAQRVLDDPAFAATVAVHLLEYVIDIKNDPTAYLGAGRLYLPKTNA